MSGIFSLFSGGRRSGQQRSLTSTDEREAHVEKGDPLATTSHCGIEVDIEFRHAEHPVEPISQDQPARCPLSEPSILNDGRIWKERLPSATPMRADLLVVKKGGTNLEKESGGRRHRSAPRSRPIL